MNRKRRRRSFALMGILDSSRKKAKYHDRIARLTIIHNKTQDSPLGAPS